MDPDQFFDPISITFWTALALVILLQGVTIGSGIWPEERRWRLGRVTLFGGTLTMVVWNGWDGYTWGWLVVFSLWGRWFVQRSPLGDLWQRREGPRWTAAYFIGFALPLLMLLDTPTRLDLITWAQMFTSLGIAGAIKTGWEAARDAWQARKLREAKPEALNGSTDRR